MINLRCTEATFTEAYCPLLTKIRWYRQTLFFALFKQYEGPCNAGTFKNLYYTSIYFMDNKANLEDVSPAAMTAGNVFLNQPRKQTAITSFRR